MKIGIYKITSPSKKVYIGQSCNINFRFNSYKKLKRCKGQTKLYSSFIKYGVNNHIFEIIEECNLEELNVKERYWQEYYDVLNKEKGLNLVLAKFDGKSGYMSDEVKEKISKANKGRIHSEEFKKRCSERMKKQGISKEAQKIGAEKRKGRKLSKYVIDKIIATKRSKSNYLIHQYSLDNNFLKEWSSLSEIKEVLGINSPNIHACITNKTKYSHGYKWKKINK